MALIKNRTRDVYPDSVTTNVRCKRDEPKKRIVEVTYVEHGKGDVVIHMSMEDMCEVWERFKSLKAKTDQDN